MNNVIGIYKITNIINGKFYIGSSEEMKDRWSAHYHQLDLSTHINKHLKGAWKKYGKENFKFEVLEECNKDILIQREQYYLDTLLFAQEYIRKEDYRFLKVGYNINPTAGKSRKGTTQSLDSIKQGLNTSGRNRKIIVVNVKNEKIDEFDYLFELLEKYNISNQLVYLSIKKKQFTLKGIGFLYEEDFIKGIILKNPKLGSRELGIPYQGKKREVFLYTIYGEFVKKFTDLYECGKYLNTAAPNIHRKMNVIHFKKYIIDSDLSRHLILDKDISIQETLNYWSSIFSRLRACNGKYKVRDCFDNYLGSTDIIDLTSILNTTSKSINTAIKRNTYLKTLKITN